MNPLTLLERYYPPGTPAHEALVPHSRRVAAKATRIARNLNGADVGFVEEAALLHDIGVLRTHAPQIGCFGELPYLCHGLQGRLILEAEGLPRHAMVCERHIGVGLKAAEIRSERLPLPERDMHPLNLEEEIIAYADLFFSKAPGRGPREKTAAEVRRKVARFGAPKAAIFDRWHARFQPSAG